jgi:hypothetical protein
LPAVLRIERHRLEQRDGLAVFTAEKRQRPQQRFAGGISGAGAVALPNCSIAGGNNSRAGRIRVDRPPQPFVDVVHGEQLVVEGGSQRARAAAGEPNQRFADRETSGPSGSPVRRLPRHPRSPLVAKASANSASKASTARRKNGTGSRCLPPARRAQALAVGSSARCRGGAGFPRFAS